MNNLSLAIQAAVQAGQEILKIYDSDFEVELKADESPLTQADKHSHQVLSAHLQPTDIPILSEEGEQTSYEERKDRDQFWLIDPLDGTKEFIKRNGEFTVNVALIKKAFPVLGVVYVPVTGTLYFGTEEQGSYKLSLADGKPLPDTEETLFQAAEKLEDMQYPDVYTVVASRSHLSPETEVFIKEKQAAHGEVATISAGSSIKLCMVAERKAHVYPRLAPTMEWDTAAGHAVAKFAGCQVLDYEKKTELQYNKKDLHNPWFIVTQ